MRKIKFRAWDNVKNKMYYTGEDEDVTFSFDSNGFVATDLTEHDWGFKTLHHLRYMQYTGLKDKNGIEIYEGDIVTYKDSANRVNHLVVKWNSLDACFDFGWVRTEYAVRGEVIGNVFQNPELLEVNK